MKMLLDPSHGWHIKELAAQTRVSPGFVHRVLARLDDEGVLVSQGRGPAKTRILSDPGALLDLWAEEQRDRIDRTLAYHLAPTSQQQRQGIVGALEAAGIGYALTGASAADLVAPLVTSVPMVQVWVSAAVDPQPVLASTPAEAVDAGHNVVFLQARDDDPLLDRQRVDDTWIVNNFRLYLDLRNDPRRGTEQANHLRQERIGF